MREWHREPSAKPEGMSMPPETQELLGILGALRGSLEGSLPCPAFQIECLVGGLEYDDFCFHSVGNNHPNCFFFSERLKPATLCTW